MWFVLLSRAQDRRLRQYGSTPWQLEKSQVAFVACGSAIAWSLLVESSIRKAEENVAVLLVMFSMSSR